MPEVHFQEALQEFAVHSGKPMPDEKLPKGCTSVECMQHHLTITDPAGHAIGEPHLAPSTEIHEHCDAAGVHEC